MPVVCLSLALVTVLSLALVCWQWLVARRFPLHGHVRSEALERSSPAAVEVLPPPVTLLKPLKGADAQTAACLQSWLEQQYPAPVQVLFGVASADDPVCALVRPLVLNGPGAELVVCPEQLGPNAKVSTLAQLEPRARHDVIVASDADVRVPPDLLAALVAPLADHSVGLVHCFYQFTGPANFAMRLEALAVNADFWSQVLQSRSLKPLDFALGAVMALRHADLERLGGFRALVEYLADDYQLGQCVARAGSRVELCTVVAECLSGPMGWRDVWRHQLRWARTIRVCQPLPYFFSILNNATVWPLAWLTATLLSNVATPPALAGSSFAALLQVVRQPLWAALGFCLCLLLRMATARDLEARLTRCVRGVGLAWLAPLKDLLHLPLWALAFLGNKVRWHGQAFRVHPGGKLTDP